MKQLLRVRVAWSLPVALVALLGVAPAVSAQAAAQQTAPAAPRVAVDLNTASQAQLEALPGVGPATAKKIIAGRPYTSVDDLSKANIPASTIDKIRPMVKVGPAGTAAAGASKGASAAAKGVEKGTSGAASGAEKGVAAGTKGVEKGAEATTSAAKKAREKVTGETPAQQPPSPGMVWVNTATGVYHKEGDRWYGRTKQGKWMTEADAMKAGYKAAKEGSKKE